jgi:hypothetical protein
LFRRKIGSKLLHPVGTARDVGGSSLKGGYDTHARHVVFPARIMKDRSEGWGMGRICTHNAQF